MLEIAKITFNQQIDGEDGRLKPGLVRDPEEQHLGNRTILNRKLVVQKLAFARKRTGFHVLKKSTLPCVALEASVLKYLSGFVVGAPRDERTFSQTEGSANLVLCIDCVGFENGFPTLAVVGAWRRSEGGIATG